MKLKETGELDKCKASLVAKGYSQEFGIDYKEVFAPVARHDTIRLVIALAAQNSWPIFQQDVKSTFLHGDLNEQVFVKQPPGYIKIGEEHKCPYEYTFFVKMGNDGKQLLMVCLYVDDLIFTGNDQIMFDKFKKSMMAEFDMLDLGRMHYFLGIEVAQSDTDIFISQRKYAQEILKRFQMANCNPVGTPVKTSLKLVKDDTGRDVDNTLYKKIVGSLMYLTATRPDITYAINLICRFMECPKEMHLQAVKRILRYLQGTTDYEILYKKGEKSTLIGFTDSDYARDQDDRKSTSGYVFMLGTGVVSWSSRKQLIVTLSTTEAELVAASACVCQAIWMRKLLEEVHFKQKGIAQP
ncbi:uncharacterized mitochondrial protein AtMg00810-like [Gossypium raimondii]|uniref:uncharacterized mitochondrial protein AtMg00810-like n=1 Tax=Gossypium raimondii TaxID=29730 RepID=UPI00227B1827|nr:uncharacterized mitochondrial protein AtMg00810-like [Gossypium raimondii]